MASAFSRADLSFGIRSAPLHAGADTAVSRRVPQAHELQALRDRDIRLGRVAGRTEAARLSRGDRGGAEVVRAAHFASGLRRMSRNSMSAPSACRQTAPRSTLHFVMW